MRARACWWSAAPSPGHRTPQRRPAGSPKASVLQPVNTGSGACLISRLSRPIHPHIMAMDVKICGITSASAVDAAVTAGAAYGGLVFHPKSPRFVMPDQARALADRMRGRLKIVALIADLDDAGIKAVVEQASPDFLQLHGGESARRVADIRARFGLPVIKALALVIPQIFTSMAMMWGCMGRERREIKQAPEPVLT
ncbi:MAG: hypothetical protein EOP93_17630, partial [Lysobacteraceae bacterium]